MVMRCIEYGEPSWGIEYRSLMQKFSASVHYYPVEKVNNKIDVANSLHFFETFDTYEKAYEWVQTEINKDQL